MDSLFSQIVGHLPDGGLYYTLLFLISMAESLAMVGLAVPGSTLIVCAGFLTAHGQGSLAGVMIAAGGGALLGDTCSYLLGARLGYRFLRRPFFRKRLTLIRKAEMFFLDHGGKSLFLGRFAGPLRGLTPFMAGSAQLSPGRFFAYTLISCLLWGLAYPGVGSLGAVSWRQVQVWSGRLSLMVTTLVIVLFANALFWSRIAPRLADRLAAFGHRIRDRWRAWLQTPLPRRWQARHPRLWRFVADRFSLRHGSGLYLTAGLCCCALFAGLFFALVANLPILVRIDQEVMAIIVRHYHPGAVRLLRLCSGLADRPVLLLWALLLAVWLLFKGRSFSAAILLAGLGGGQGLIFMLQRLIARPGPQPPFSRGLAAPSAFPDEHAFFALLLGGLTVYLMLGSIRNWQSRLSLITSFSFLALLVGLSRVFSGVRWFSDALAGWSLAALWLSFLVTALEVRRQLAGETLWHRKWPGPGFNPRLEKFFWGAAGGLTLLGILQHLISLWNIG